MVRPAPNTSSPTDRGPPTEALAGLVERVTFHNADTGFCVLRVKVRGQRDPVTVVGYAALISAGEFVSGSGIWVNDRTHVDRVLRRRPGHADALASLPPWPSHAFIRVSVETATLKDRRNGCEYQALVGLAEALPSGIKVCPVTDRGFGDRKLYRLLIEDLKFDLVIRFHTNITVIAAADEVRQAANRVGPNDEDCQQPATFRVGSAEAGRRLPSILPNEADEGPRQWDARPDGRESGEPFFLVLSLDHKADLGHLETQATLYGDAASKISPLIHVHPSRLSSSTG